MKAHFIEHYGKDSPLVFGERPEPELLENDLLIDIRAASINPLDAKIIHGEFKQVVPHKMPLILGHDFSGVVTKVGSGVKRFKVGDAVYGGTPINRIGAFAERIAVDESYMAPKPKNLSFEQAAALPVVALTAWQFLVEIAKVKPGQKVFIQAGSGGVGTIAIQLAKHLGATVATTASAASADALKALGADIVVDYRKDDFASMLKGYDAALLSQDEASLIKAIGILKPGAVAVSIAGPPDPAFARQRGMNVLLQAVMWGLSYRVRKAARKAGVAYSFLFTETGGGHLRQFNPLLESGAVSPVLDKVFPFDQAAQALAHVQSGRAKGKVVISVSAS